jgi:hypothetical protein
MIVWIRYKLTYYNSFFVCFPSTFNCGRWYFPIFGIFRVNNINVSVRKFQCFFNSFLWWVHFFAFGFDIGFSFFPVAALLTLAFSIELKILDASFRYLPLAIFKVNN